MPAPARRSALLCMTSAVSNLAERYCITVSNSMTFECGASDREQTSELVSYQRARPSVASHARSLCDLDFRNHAAANAGEHSDSLLGALDARIAGHRISR